MKKTISIILLFALIFSVAGCTPKNKLSSDLLPEYIHYNQKDYDKLVNKIYETLSDNKTDEVLSLYDQLYYETELIGDMNFIAFTNYYIDCTDEKWAKEMDFYNELVTSSIDKLSTLGHDLIISDISDEFKDHIKNDKLISYYEEYVPLSDETIEALNRENDLLIQFVALDPDEEGFIDSCSDIFIDMVNQRKIIAKGYGYDDYAAYADEKIYYRNYSDDMLKVFYKAIKDIDIEKLESISSDISKDIPDHDSDRSTIIEDTQNSILGISDAVQGAFDFMVSNNLYWFDDDENNYATGYTDILNSVKVPFIFNNLEDGIQDYYYQVHELGHFANYYYAPNDILMINYGSYDLSEIQSQALELLCMKNIQKEAGLSDAVGIYYKLIGKIKTIAKACLYDEWQREVYENQNMTIEEIDDLFYELSCEYGFNYTKEEAKREWRELTHNFDSPMYYLSYGTSSLAAIQLWYTSLTDFNKAISQYEYIVKLDLVEYGYEDAINKCNMIMFDDYDNVTTLLNDTIEYISNGLE